MNKYGRRKKVAERVDASLSPERTTTVIFMLPWLIAPWLQLRTVVDKARSIQSEVMKRKAVQLGAITK